MVMNVTLFVSVQLWREKNPELLAEIAAAE